jgi:hypothetical protein
MISKDTGNPIGTSFVALLGDNSAYTVYTRPPLLEGLVAMQLWWDSRDGHRGL